LRSEGSSQQLKKMKLALRHKEETIRSLKTKLQRKEEDLRLRDDKMLGGGGAWRREDVDARAAMADLGQPTNRGFVLQRLRWLENTCKEREAEVEALQSQVRVTQINEAIKQMQEFEEEVYRLNHANQQLKERLGSATEEIQTLQRANRRQAELLKEPERAGSDIDDVGSVGSWIADGLNLSSQKAAVALHQEREAKAKQAALVAHLEAKEQRELAAKRQREAAVKREARLARLRKKCNEANGQPSKKRHLKEAQHTAAVIKIQRCSRGWLSRERSSAKAAMAKANEATEASGVFDASAVAGAEVVSSDGAAAVGAAAGALGDGELEGIVNAAADGTLPAEDKEDEAAAGDGGGEETKRGKEAQEEAVDALGDGELEGIVNAAADGTLPAEDKEGEAAAAGDGGEETKGGQGTEREE
jgi:hypothetical protein